LALPETQKFMRNKTMERDDYIEINDFKKINLDVFKIKQTKNIRN